jgi:hypothetical protein
MKLNKSISIFLTLSLLLFSSKNLVAQQAVNHHVNFATKKQDMWGPKLNPIIIDKETTLFEQAWNENFDTGNSMIGSVAGYYFGAALKGSFSGAIGSKVSLKGFNSGSIDVDYPVDIQLDMPTDNTYDQGDEVVIKTNYIIDTIPKYQYFR